MLSKKLQNEALENLDSDNWEEWFDGLSSEEQKEVGDFAFSIFNPKPGAG